MQEDFHYYATYCAAFIAGYSHEESLDICYSAQFVDCCSRTFISKVKGPSSAATTQLQLEMVEMRTDMVGLQDITRIWSSFHFLPRDLNADSGVRNRRYTDKYRLICGPNGDLLKKTVETAKAEGTLQSAGIAMHVLADTWAHTNFAGTPSFVINNTNFWFNEIIPADEQEEGHAEKERPVKFGHNIAAPDSPENGTYTNSVNQINENSIMNLGHGRAGHLPDYSYARYKYMPAWGNYEEILKDNPADYYRAFCQMVYALKYLRGDIADFAVDTYDWDAVAQWKEEIRSIIEKRRLNGSEDWKAFGEKLSGKTIDDFDIDRYEDEYMGAESRKKEKTFLGNFFIGAIAQKSMVTNEIFSTGSLLAGYSIDYSKTGGLKEYRKMAEIRLKRRNRGAKGKKQ